VISDLLLDFRHSRISARGQRVPERFDVFLSYNRRNKPVAEEIGGWLSGQRLRVWLDMWNLRPGFPWQVGIEQGVLASRAAAVLVGAGGLGKWQSSEVQTFIRRSKEEQVPVIPVLLPGCADSPELGLFLEEYEWVDLREGLTADGLARLLWGITGQEPLRPSGLSYGWLFDVDGYRVAYIPLLNDWRSHYIQKGILDLDITADSLRFQLPESFQRTVGTAAHFVDRPSCRLAFYSLAKDRLTVRLAETSYGDYLRSGEHLDDPVPGTPERTYRDEFGQLCRTGSGDFQLFPLTNICGVGVFVLTSDNYIVATIHSEKSHVYPLRHTFAASGTMRWGAAPDPFAAVLRKAEDELNHQLNVRQLRLIGFGADARKLYFQFSFLERTTSNMREIQERCPAGALLLKIQFSLEQVSAALLGHCWEPAAEAALLTLSAQRFGADAVAKALADMRTSWALREMRDEWDYRASRPGLLPDMSIRYPPKQLKKGSDRYLKQCFAFIRSVAGKRVVEVGSGTGRFTEQLLASGAEVTCLELSDRMVARMRTRLAGAKVDTSKLTVVPGLAQDHLSGKQQDLAICSLVLIHNVRNEDCRALIQGLCGSAASIFVFEDVTQDRRTSPHTRLRPEQSLVEMFAQQHYRLVKRKHHQLFTDTIAFLKFEREVAENKTSTSA
jgi:SAM-dependent methyltransferase